MAAASVAELIAAEYDVAAPVSCRLFSKLLRTQDNDHYLATTGDGTQYAFRIYQQGDRYHRAESDYLYDCLLYTSDAADERSSVDLGGRRIIKKKKISRQR